MSYLVIETGEGNIRDVFPTSSLKKAIKKAAARGETLGYAQDVEIFEWYSDTDGTARVAVWDVEKNDYVFIRDVK